MRQFGTSGPNRTARKPTSQPLSLAAEGDTTRQHRCTTAAAALARWEVAEVVLRFGSGTLYRT